MAFAGSQARVARAMTQPMKTAFQRKRIGVSMDARRNVASTLFPVADTADAWTSNDQTRAQGGPLIALASSLLRDDVLSLQLRCLRARAQIVTESALAAAPVATSTSMVASERKPE